MHARAVAALCAELETHAAEKFVSKIKRQNKNLQKDLDAAHEQAAKMAEANTIWKQLGGFTANKNKNEAATEEELHAAFDQRRLHSTAQPRSSSWSQQARALLTQQLRVPGKGQHP